MRTSTEKEVNFLAASDGIVTSVQELGARPSTHDFEAAATKSHNLSSPKRFITRYSNRVKKAREDLIEKSSKLQSRRLGNALRKSLPRELRDLIYASYLNTNPIDWYRLVYNTYWNRASFCTGKYLPHFILYNYPGRDTAREVGQVAFRMGLFQLRDHAGVLQLRHFLEYDHLRLGLVPGDLIRNIVISIDVIFPFEKNAINLEDKSSYPSETLGPRLGRIRSNLDALANLRLKRNFNLQLKFGERSNAAIVLHILHMFLPAYRHLKDNKANITVNYARRFGRNKPVISLNSLMELPIKEWRTRMMEECIKVSTLNKTEISWTEKMLLGRPEEEEEEEEEEEDSDG
ncbi:hypothetical protein K504DRAFT_28564 [Pleomassaria siparia CBS 279.74]|uniref:Uncharacterized protein n=1 Tax=Pleomassaria siparia CBS 279.74 TaxID=1314801 RepID=A0A6G1KRK7_9PLEO|nr:hypothetical protein K504DRAFT_28564 [Pleomassaria siparia CBS 279.74]